MPLALKLKKNDAGARSPAPLAASLTRRNLARLAVGGGLYGLFLPEPGEAARIERVRRLSVRYRTDPKRIARLLPPLLTADVLPDISLDYLSIAGRGLSPLSEDKEEEFGWFTLQAAARYGRLSGMIVLGLITDHEFGRIQAREFLGLPAKPGNVSLSVDGTTLRASCSRDGRSVQRLETSVTNRPAHPLALPGSTGFGSFVFRYAPGVDSSKAVIDPPVELWRVGASAPTASEPDAAEGAEENAARACDISRTKFTWGPSAWADAEVALPVREFVGAAYQELTGEEAVEWRRNESRREQVFLAKADPSRFAPWGLSRYDRPFSFAKEASRAARTKIFVSGKLSPAELSTYRSRKEDELGPMSLIEFRLSTDPELHAEILPPGCEPGRRPLLRLLVLRAEKGDFSRRPFQEAWLFAYCRVEGRPRWYALSHVTGEGGEVLLGRERFGYPTVEGRVSVGVSPDGFNFSGSRQGREFVRGAGSFRSFSTGLSLSRINIVALRARPFRPDNSPEGELIEQTWFYQGRRHYADPRNIEIEFPGDPGSGVDTSDSAPKTTPWFEPAPFQVVSAGAMEDAHMQRGAGRIVQAVPDFEPFYRERCDGVLPGELLPTAPLQPTFRNAPDPRPRS